ncbi:MAG: transcription-repair coupling factor, partial [Parvularculaceae bacterium]|nr:transcription-repair coupling factor [Parvularculaceae bacterium]
MAMVSGVGKIGADEAWRSDASFTVHDAPDGADAMALADAARTRSGLIVYVARDAARASEMAAALAFFAPEIARIDFPAWDCLPYDRVSPSSAVTAARMAALSLLSARQTDDPLILITSVNAVTQRTPPKEIIKASAFSAKPGETVSLDKLTAYLAANGYSRASTVREPGEFAVRGGLVDLYPPGADEPLRLDFFGDTLESVRAFDPMTQLTTRQLSDVNLSAATEVLLTDETIAAFRAGFRAQFGAASDDPVYEAVSAGRKQSGMEHWLPLYYEGASTIFDFLGGGMLFIEHLADEAASDRFASIEDYYSARAEDMLAPRSKNNEFSAPAYRPLKPDGLYLSPDEWSRLLDASVLRRLSPFSPPEGRRAFSFGAKTGRTFAAERAADKVNVFD